VASVADSQEGFVVRGPRRVQIGFPDRKTGSPDRKRVPRQSPDSEVSGMGRLFSMG
jgi:hypothetical protein